MENKPVTSEYREADCIFQINRKTRVLKVIGEPDRARLTILKLRREGWLSDDMRAIWFDTNPALLVTGINLTLYMASKPEKPRPAPRSFKDMVQST